MLRIDKQFCVLIISDAKDDELILDFAYLCINNRPDIKALMNHYIYPVGLSVSMMCFILTFLLYSFLPQLRDLTGKFILGICSFMSIAFAAMLVDMFGWKDPNVEKLTTETVLHGSIVGVWFCLNAMGHHAWKIIKSKVIYLGVLTTKPLENREFQFFYIPYFLIQDPRVLIVISHSPQMQVLLENTVFSLNKIIRNAGIIRIAGIIRGRVLYEEIRYVKTYS